MNPLIKGLYCFYHNKELEFSEKIEVFIRIKHNDEELFEQIKYSQIIKKFFSQLSQDLLGTANEVP